MCDCVKCGISVAVGVCDWFDGQVVAMDGINSSGRRFVANKIYEVVNLCRQLKLFCLCIETKSCLNRGICSAPAH